MDSERKSGSASLSASILLLCGLPGSGKSTLASSISKHYKEENTSKFCKVEHIEYDSIASGLSQTYDIESTAEATTCSSGGTQTCEHFTDGDLKAWKQTRKEALKLLEEHLRSTRRKVEDRESNQDGESILIIMDDNFHLRSMRRDILKTCQDFIVEYESSLLPSNQVSMAIGLSTLYVNTPIIECIRNNENRLGTPQYIPPRVIQAMSTTLEPPDVQKAKFEKYSVDTSQWDIDTVEFYHKLDECLKKSVLYDPIQLPPPTKSPEEMEKERLATLQSRLHRIDLLLRTLVGTTCRTNKKFAKIANEARKNILKECKDDSFNFDAASISNALDDETFVLRRFDEIVLENADSADCEEIRLEIRKNVDSFKKS